MPRKRPMTWCFNLTLQMPTFSAEDDGRMVFSSILEDEDTRLAIHDLKQSLFSYDVPGERGLAEISGYLHTSRQITEATVKIWIFNGRIFGEHIDNLALLCHRQSQARQLETLPLILQLVCQWLLWQLLYQKRHLQFQESDSQ